MNEGHVLACTIKPSFDPLAKAATSRSTSPASRMFTGSPPPQRRATDWMAVKLADPWDMEIAKHRHPRHARRDLFEYFQPFRADVVIVRQQNRWRCRQAAPSSRPSRRRLGRPSARTRSAPCWSSGVMSRRRCPRGQNGVRRKCDQFRRIFAKASRAGAAPAIVDPDVAADSPAQLLQTLKERREVRLSLCIIGGDIHKDTDAPHTPVCCARAVSGHTAAALPKSVMNSRRLIDRPSSARATSAGAIVKPSALAVLRLRMNSNFDGCSTGRSAGFAPLKILSRYEPARRYRSE